MSHSNRQVGIWVAIARGGEDARRRIEAGHPMPGDEARVREARDAERKLAKQGFSLHAARQGAIYRGRDRAGVAA